MPPGNPAAYQNPFGLGMISMPQPQSFSNSFPQETSQQFGPTAPQPMPQPNPVAQAGNQALGLYGTYQAGSQLGDGLGTMFGGSPSTPVNPPANIGYDATQQALGMAPQAPPMTPVPPANMTPVPPVEPGILGSISAAPWYIPAAVVAATGMGVSSALQSHKAGQEQGVWGGVKEGFNDFGDLGTAFATGGLSIPANLAAATLGGLFKSGKGKDQQGRDVVRGSLRDQGYLSPDFMLELQKSGINLDLGKDGGFRYGEGTPGERPVYNLDWENDPNVPQAVGWLKPFTLLIANGDEKLASDFTAQFYNELTKDGKATDPATIKARILDLYHKFELKPSVVRSAIEAMNLPQGEKDAAFAAIDNLRPGSTTTQGPDIPKFQTPSIQQPQKPQSTAPDKPLGEAPKPTPQPEKPKSTGGTASALPSRGIGLYGRR